MPLSLEALEEKLGYTFLNQELLVRALTHRSWLAESGSTRPEKSDNEQLEFLGDSILGFVSSETLVTCYPSAAEGQLSQWKAHLVSAVHLHTCALQLDLGEHLLLGKGEARNGGRHRKTLLANALEAVIAAIYIDGGMDAARDFVEEHILGGLESPRDVESMSRLNSKSALQEKTQALRMPAPRYVTVETSGPEHAKVFTIEARIGKDLVSRATGTSKKAASQQAAELLLAQLDSVLQSSAS